MQQFRTISAAEVYAAAAGGDPAAISELCSHEASEATVKQLIELNITQDINGIENINNDVCAHTKVAESHIELLRKTFQRIKEKGMKLRQFCNNYKSCHQKLLLMYMTF